MLDRLQQYHDDALAWVNQIRQQHGAHALAEMPCGAPFDEAACPVAQALPGTKPEVGKWELSFEVDGAEIDLRVPEEVSVFITAFDTGEYPHLIEDEA